MSVDDLKTEWQRRDAEQQKKDRMEWENILNKQKGPPSLPAQEGDLALPEREIWSLRKSEITARDQAVLQQDLEKLKIPTLPDKAHAALKDALQATPPAQLRDGFNGKVIDNFNEAGWPRTWIRQEPNKAPHVLVLTRTNEVDQSLSLVDKETRLRHFKGRQEELAAFIKDEKIMPVTASFGIKRLQSGSTEVYLLFDQTRRQAVFTGTKDAVERFAGEHLFGLTEIGLHFLGDEMETQQTYT